MMETATKKMKTDATATTIPSSPSPETDSAVVVSVADIVIDEDEHELLRDAAVGAVSEAEQQARVKSLKDAWSRIATLLAKVESFLEDSKLRKAVPWTHTEYMAIYQ